MSEIIFSNEASPRPSPVSPGDLDAWHSGLRTYEESVSVNVKKIGGMFGGHGTTTRIGLIQEASHSKSVLGTDGATERWGIAVRLVVAVDKWDLHVGLTIPAVAAAVQLGMATASAALDVTGYKGDLSKLLPSATGMSVDAYSEYITSWHAIVAKVEGDVPNQVPELLERTPAAADLPPGAGR